MRRISDHAKHRGKQRFKVRDVSNFLHNLWRTARPATDEDFTAFNTRQLSGREYRVNEYRGVPCLIVRSTTTNKFVTVIRNHDE